MYSVHAKQIIFERHLNRRRLLKPNNTRWWSKFEQLYFIVKCESVIDNNLKGIDVIIKVCEECVRHAYCKETAHKLLKFLSNKWNRAYVEVELSVTSLYGKIFAESTYLLEGDQPLWSQTYRVMEKLSRFLVDGPSDEQWQPTKNSCTNAARLVSDLSKAVQQKFVDAENKVREITSTLTELSSRLERVTDDIRNRTGVIAVNNTPRGHQASRTLRTVRRVTERVRAQNQDQRQTNARRTTAARQRANELLRQKVRIHHFPQLMIYTTICFMTGTSSNKSE